MRLCRRRLGIGADGLILIRKTEEADFEMLYFNADGKLGSMCGNGGRCAVHFARTLGIFEQKTTFKAFDGIHEAEVREDVVRLSMSAVADVEINDQYFFLNTGSPHYVRFVSDLQTYPVLEEGKKVRYDALFAPGGTNVNFAEVSEKGLFLRTYERGVEDETLSCGTGVTATAIAAHFRGFTSPLRIQTPGGLLTVEYEVLDGVFKNIFLTGAAKKVFEGIIEI
jgi:diaminopimelate epimerase